MKGARRARGRRRVVATLAIAALGALALVAMPLSSGAVNFASFQLDGDTAGADDWDSLYPSSSIFTQDGSGPSDDQLVQGTADKLDFDSWTWRAQQVTPPKSDIQWAYATPAVVNNELVLYFGSDRANDDKAGSVNVGFWFLQGDVGPQSGGSFGPDRHQPGDLFVAAEIDSGGRVANIAVYKWDPSAQKNLALQTSGSYGECSGGTLGSLVACGIANNSSSIRRRLARQHREPVLPRGRHQRQQAVRRSASLLLELPLEHPLVVLGRRGRAGHRRRPDQHVRPHQDLEDDRPRAEPELRLRDHRRRARHGLPARRRASRRSSPRSSPGPTRSAR